jgi:exodeoxyribonuclease VII large subunit
VVGSAGAARAAGTVTLHFRDGEVDAKVERAGTKAYGVPKPEQPMLL